MAGLLILVINLHSYAFTVVLKSGQQIQGTWMEENSFQIRIRDTNGMIRTFPKSALDLQAMSSKSRFDPDAVIRRPSRSSDMTKTATQHANDATMQRRDETIAVPTRPDDAINSTPRLPAGRLWTSYVLVSNEYDTNINHDSQDLVDSVGVVFGAGIRWQNNLSKPAWELSYEIGKHSYTNTDLWDRVSHNMKASYEWRFAKRWSLETGGEIAIKGATEDREIGNQYSVKPKLKYKITQSNRLEFVGTYRLKRYDVFPERDAINTYYGFAFEHRFGEQRLEFGWRREQNNADGARYDYLRYIYSLDYTIPFATRNWISFEAEYKPQRYYNRFGTIDVDHGPDIRFLRHDQRWVFTAATAIALSQHMDLVLGYQYETRSSNDPDKFYDAHQPGLMLRYVW